MLNRHPKGIPTGGQFAPGVHGEPDVSLHQSAAPPIEAGLNHARSMVLSTGLKALSSAVPARDREVFADRNKIAWEYRVALEHLDDTGKNTPQDFTGFADACDARAADAEKARGWTPRARRRNATNAQMYRYLAGTLRNLADGEAPTANRQPSPRAARPTTSTN